MSIRRILRNKKFRKFILCLSKLTDNRQKGKVKHPIESCLTIIILAELSGCNFFREFVLFAKKHESKLKKLCLLPNGLPSHDTLERVVNIVDKIELNKSLALLLFPHLKGRPIISIDGKCIRATKSSTIKGTYGGMKNIVTMFMCDSKLSLLSFNNKDKGNEINVIPKLIELFHKTYPEVKSYISIDAIGVTHEILSLLKKYDYDFVIAYKRSEVTIKELALLNDPIDVATDIQKNSSRIETRTFSLYSPDDIAVIYQWRPYISYIGKMSSRVEHTIINESTTSELFYFVSDISIEEFKKVRRHHWKIENSLHWILDNSFKEDRQRLKKGSSAENMNLLRKFVLNVIALTNYTNESVSSFRDKLKYDTPQELLYKIINSIA